MNLSQLVKSQIPNHIEQNFPLFVEFLSSYYDWLETQGAYKDIKNHLDYMSFEKSLKEYTDIITNQYLYKLPIDLITDKEKLVNHSKDIIANIGSEQAFKFLFKLIYDEDIEIYYPKKDIFKLSSGKWIGSESVIYVTDNDGIEDSFLYRKISQTYEYLPGAFKTATATVHNIKTRNYGKYRVAELYLTDEVGEFVNDAPITSFNGHEEYIYPVSNNIDIDLTQVFISGTINSKIELQPNQYYIKSYVATSRTIDTFLTTTFKNDEIVVYLNDALVDSVDYTFDGRSVHFNIVVNISDVVDVHFPFYAGYLTAGAFDESGHIKTINIVDSPMGIQAGQDLRISVDDFVSNTTVIPSIVQILGGRYLNTNGRLSSTKKLQDSDYYQEFSYVIRTGMDVERYRDFVLEFLHPAGFKMFGQVDITFAINILIDINSSIDEKTDALLEAMFNGNILPDWEYLQNLIAVYPGAELYTNDIHENVPASVVAYNINNAVMGTETNLVCYDDYVVDSLNYYQMCYVH